MSVITADLNDFEAPRKFERVVAIECFEHMKNYQLLLRKVAAWMTPGALFFCHVFCHKTIAYHFEVRWCLCHSSHASTRDHHAVVAMI